jgi:broad specificity phosphatase PhoE
VTGVKMLEVRRHALTKKGAGRGRGSSLSADGVRLARALGVGGPFAHVLTSDAPRALETAIAMGFAVDATVAVPSGYVAGEIEHHDQWSWAEPYVAYRTRLGRSAGLLAAVEAHRAQWLDAVSAVADGESALVVSHGGIIEPTLVSFRPDDDHAGWGAPFAHCDGARLAFDGGECRGVEFLRAGS